MVCEEPRGTTHEQFSKLARAIVGEGYVLNGSDCERYEQGMRYGTGRALCVVRPQSVSEVSDIVKEAVKAGLTIVPQGANTGLVEGSIPDRSGSQVVLSVERLRAECQLDNLNRSVDVSAGFRLSELNRFLEREGFVLPIDLGADPMVGGMVGANTGGAKYIRYGDVRRRILSLEVVLFDKAGTILRLGGPMRKNNATLGLKELVVGSGGALGVVTKATFEVERLPADTATALLIPKNESAVDSLLERLEISLGPLITACEFMSGDAMRLALQNVPTSQNPFARGEIPSETLLVEIAVPDCPGLSADAVLESTLTAVFEQRDTPMGDALFGRGSGFWALRHALSEGLREAGHVIAFDLGFARSETMPFRIEAKRVLQETWPDLLVCDFGHIADGGLHFNCVWPKEKGPIDAQTVENIRKSVLDLAVLKYHASFSAEHGLGRANCDAFDRYTPIAISNLSDRVTRCFTIDGVTSLM